MSIPFDYETNDLFNDTSIEQREQTIQNTNHSDKETSNNTEISDNYFQYRWEANKPEQQYK